jgi:hypothetical protein
LSRQAVQIVVAEAAVSGIVLDAVTAHPHPAPKTNCGYMYRLHVTAVVSRSRLQLVPTVCSWRGPVFYSRSLRRRRRQQGAAAAAARSGGGGGSGSGCILANRDMSLLKEQMFALG